MIRSPYRWYELSNEAEFKQFQVDVLELLNAKAMSQYWEQNLF